MVTATKCCECGAALFKWYSLYWARPLELRLFGLCKPSFCLTRAIGGLHRPKRDVLLSWVQLSDTLSLTLQSGGLDRPMRFRACPRFLLTGGTLGMVSVPGWCCRFNTALSPALDFRTVTFCVRQKGWLVQQHFRRFTPYQKGP